MEALQFSWWNVQGVWHFRGHNMSGRYAMHGWKVSGRYISAPTPLPARMPGDTAGVVLLGDTGKQTLGCRAWMRGGKGVKTFKNPDNVQCPFQRGKRGGFVCSARRVWQIWGARCGSAPGFLHRFCREASRRSVETGGKEARECAKNIGLLVPKPPYFRGKTSDVCLEEVRCFSISGRKMPEKRGKIPLKRQMLRFAEFRDLDLRNFGTHGW